MSKAILDAKENHNFHGQPLTAAFYPWSPFCIVHGDGLISGILPTLAEDIARMLNLSMQLVPFREKGKFGSKLPNGTWTGNIAEVAQGHVHTSVSGQAYTAERNEIVDFTYPVATTLVAVFIKRSGAADVSAQSYLSQYPVTSWLAVIFMYLFCWIIIMFHIHWQNRITWANTKANPLVVSTESTVLALMNKPLQLKPAILSQKIAFLSVFLMALVVLSYYKALLKATLSVRTFRIPLDSYKDILDSPLEFLVWKNGAAEDMFRLAPPGSVMKQIHESKIQDKPGPLDLGGVAKSFERVRNGKAIYYGSAENKMSMPMYPCGVTDIKSLR